MENIDLEQVYEQAFFTLNNSTVELILNKNILSWSKVSADGMFHHFFFCIFNKIQK